MRKNLFRINVLFCFSVSFCWASVARGSAYPLEQFLKETPLEQQARKKLEAQDIGTTNQLLEAGATGKQRAILAKAIGVKRSVLYKWVKMCDLLRIGGVGPEMVRLLGVAGVVTVKQFMKQDAKKLHGRLIRANKLKKVTENPPSEGQLKEWIAQANNLKLIINLRHSKARPQ